MNTSPNVPIFSKLSEMQATQNSPSKRLLVIKHGALGDIVQGFGAFASLRHGNPKGYIALLTTPPFAELARLMPWFDEVIVDRRAGVLNILEGLRMRRLLRQNWDFIVDLQSSRRSANYFKFLSKPGVRWIGTAEGCSDPCPNFDGVNNYQRMLVAADMAGGVRAVRDISWLLNGSCPAVVQNVQKPFAVLVPGCSLAKPKKRWPSEKFAELAIKLRAQNFSVILVGTLADSNVVGMVHSLAPGCIDLCGKTSIAELASLSALADYVIGNDTGPVFLAAATGTPTIMVMGPETDPTMSAPTGERCDWIQRKAIGQVSVDEVLKRVSELASDVTRD